MNNNLHPLFKGIVASQIAGYADHYYDRQQRLQDAKDEVLFNKAESLMNDDQDCDPFNEDNIGEAFSNIEPSDLEYLKKCLRSRNLEEIGVVVIDLLVDYWQKEAYRVAEKEAL